MCRPYYFQKMAHFHIFHWKVTFKRDFQYKPRIFVLKLFHLHLAFQNGCMLEFYVQHSLRYAPMCMPQCGSSRIHHVKIQIEIQSEKTFRKTLLIEDLNSLLEMNTKSKTISSISLWTWRQAIFHYLYENKNRIYLRFKVEFNLLNVPEI